MLSLTVFAAIVIAIYPSVNSQQSYFNGCDYLQRLEMDRLYDVFSPQFPQNYPPNTRCRWTGCAPYGTNIFVNCSNMNIPTTSNCAGDRLEVSLNGCQDLSDAERFCNLEPFTRYTRANVIVMALQVPPSTIGGRFFCQIQARPSSQPAYVQARYPTQGFPQQIAYQQPLPPPPPPITSSQNQPTYTYQPSNRPSYQPATYAPSQQPIQSQSQNQPQYTPVIVQQPGQATVTVQQPSYQPTVSSPTSSTTCECGLKKTAKIVGGSDTLLNEYPFSCGIMDMSIKRVICGCTIIDTKFVLTSAHCVINQTLTNLGLIVGNQDYMMQSQSPYTSIYRFIGFIPYPSYDPITYLNDIAIMRVYNEIQFNPGVSAVCLPLNYRLNQNNFVYAQVEATGWGRISFGGPTSSSLQKVTLNVIPNTECNKSYPYQISSAQMCTYTPFKDTCDMDDGGPMYFTDTVSGRVYVVGIVSYGVGCASRMPRVHTRVTAYLSWIQSTTNATFCNI